MSKTDKIYIALLLLIAAGGIGTREYQSHKIDAFNPDGHYLDSILKEKGWPKESIIHLPITSDTATPETKAFYDSSVRAQEEDSATPAKGFGFNGRPFFHNIIEDTIPDTMIGVFESHGPFGTEITFDGNGHAGSIVSFEGFRRAEWDRQIRLAKRYDSVLNARLWRQNFIPL